MIIQINTDKTLNGDHQMQEYFTFQIEEALQRYSSHISRIEVHMKDENGKKEGIDDMSCRLEARINGRQPIAISNQADSMELALLGAIVKIKTALKTTLGRIQHH
ncbi:MAG: hypothetical protein ACJA1A_001655 [Saprospiraceae bacterium]|jgi:hypothetical protein|tara:strand:+ start:1343 stop:1657 length:315 start_codon:yes stop_codon:yes gene_type:complete